MGGGVNYVILYLSHHISVRLMYEDLKQEIEQVSFDWSFSELPAFKKKLKAKYM